LGVRTVACEKTARPPIAMVKIAKKVAFSRSFLLPRSARATAHTPKWCAPIVSPDQADTF